nr:reverse transcriptase domain-containing protein [Tanacetum cinerariifolium]
MAAKVNNEKVQQEKLEEVKARLNFEGWSGRNSKIQEMLQYSESKTPNKKGDLRGRLKPRRLRSVSKSPERTGVFSRIQRDRSASPRRRHEDKRIREGDVFYRLGVEEKVCEMMRITTAFLRGEVAASNQVRKKAPPIWKQQEVGRKQNFNRRGDFTNQQRYERRRDKFTLLTKSLKEILALDKGEFKAPPLMTTPVEKRNNNKFCEFHREPWQRVARQKVTQIFFPSSEISFPPLRDKDGMKGPMIIDAEIGGHFIHRIYVDGGSASEVLYEHCFNRLHPEVKSQMIPATVPIIGFCREIIWPMGQILLLVKIGDAEHFTYTTMNFVVVRSPSPYNEIIARPGVRKIQAVPSTAHEMLKFLVPGGILTLRSSRIIPRECTMVSGPEAQPSGVIQATEERIKVAMYDLLRRSRGVFAWKPAYMTGVPRHIAKHRLNVREGCSPVRQNKRSQTPKRNKAIQEEVEKLVDAGIMKEVHYHSWLSNPVMVKKHDDSWRMCVDFKDLNNACPKDECQSDLPASSRQSIPKQIGRNLEVYVDDLVIKSHTEHEIITDIEETFKTLREINMKLNPKKCTLGIEECVFLGYKVNTKGIKVCMDKVEAVLSLQSPKCLKDVQKLNGKQASLNRFLSKSTEKSLPFFKTLKKPRTSVKGKILADFPDTPMEVEEDFLDPWTLFTDVSSCVDGFGVGLILTDLEGGEFTYALRFRFEATNNEAE